MSADNFGAEYEQRQPSTFRIPAARITDDGAADHLREQIATLEEALREAWRVFDSLGAYQSDDAKLAVLSGHAFRRRRTWSARQCSRFRGESHEIRCHHARPRRRMHMAGVCDVARRSASA